MSTVTHRKRAVHFHAGIAQGSNLLEESHGIEHHSVSDDASAARAQHSARNQLQNELFVVDDDRVPRIVSAGIARHYGEIFGEDVNYFALAFIAPLRTYDDRRLALFQIPLHGSKSRGRPGRIAGSHTLVAPTWEVLVLNSWNVRRAGVYWT